MIENLAERARLPQMFAQMWAVHNLSQWYSALINGATRAAYFRGAVGITPVTGIYRGFSAERRKRERESEKEKGWKMPVAVESETDQRRRYLQSWAIAATQSEKRRGGGTRERAGSKGVHGDAEKREGWRRGILGTRIDAVLSNHVLRLLLSFTRFLSCLPSTPLHPSPP